MNIAIVTDMEHTYDKYIWDLIKGLNKEKHDVSIFAKEDSKIPKIGRLMVCKKESDVMPQYSYLFGMFDIIHDFSKDKEVHKFCQTNNIESVATNFNDDIYKDINTINALSNVKYDKKLLVQEHIKIYEKILNGEKNELSD